jgi:hypothetical protein
LPAWLAFIILINFIQFYTVFETVLFYN